MEWLYSGVDRTERLYPGIGWTEPSKTSGILGVVSKFIHHQYLSEETKVSPQRRSQVVISIRTLISTVLEEPDTILKTR